MPGLSTSDIVNVAVTLTPLPVPLRNFGNLMIIGPTEGVINVGERFRPYVTITEVAADFGTTAPEYLAASLFFDQNPQPAFVYIGRWAQSATHAWLFGAVRSTAQQLLATWNAISAGSMSITIDGVVRNLTGLNFSTAQNLNGVAAIIQAALPAGAQCIWDSVYDEFKVRGVNTGTSGTISFATPTGSGQDISALSGLTSAQGASAPVAGIAAETPLACITIMATLSNDWYGVMFAPTNATDITDNQYTAAANFIEASNPSRVFGITTMEAVALDITQTTDLGSVLQALNLQHTMVMYSSSSAYAVASALGRAFTVDFTANNSVITLKFKEEPGVVAETLAESQAASLKSKNINVYVNYNNGVAIIQEGVMSGGFFFDERQGLDWLQNVAQTNIFNVLFTSPTKIPLTDPGVHLLATALEAAFASGINNGLIAPGTWNSNAVFGTLTTGQFLPLGYYVFVPSVNTQNEATRAARIAPTMQAAVKLAGAVHFAGAAISVNR